MVLTRCLENQSVGKVQGGEEIEKTYVDATSNTLMVRSLLALTIN